MMHPNRLSILFKRSNSATHIHTYGRVEGFVWFATFPPGKPTFHRVSRSNERRAVLCRHIHQHDASSGIPFLDFRSVSCIFVPLTCSMLSDIRSSLSLTPTQVTSVKRCMTFRRSGAPTGQGRGRSWDAYDSFRFASPVTI